MGRCAAGKNSCQMAGEVGRLGAGAGVVQKPRLGDAGVAQKNYYRDSGCATKDQRHRHVVTGRSTIKNLKASTIRQLRSVCKEAVVVNVTRN